MHFADVSMSLSEDPVHVIPATTQLRRSRSRWRIIAFVALAIAVVALVGRFALSAYDGDTAQIARVRIEGAITTDAARLHVLNKLAESEKVKAVIISINSPGGTTAGGEELYEAISRLREEKPVVAVIEELGASAAYMTAISTDRIFARRLSIVGSIGVLMQHVNAGKLLDTIGISMDKVQTGPLKAEPDISDPLVGEVRESLQALVDDSFEWFVDIVAERRDMPRPAALALADGRIVTGRMGLENGLIDAIGGEAEAIAWLESEKDIAPDLAIVTQFPPALTEFERITHYFGSQIRAMVGLGPENGMTLDGLVSLWQVAPSK